ncbi:hypothetical protein HMPREF1317_0300 [Schaalia georgiae F0490]|uniref:Uncharacterized protein n=1 Tax=Schaalia georgiae F0490 TaxID=1125717 RepID=J0MNL2_9ACTO|nr:hypothetical protein [Schaalia georgiae]EJF35819.1 hypothetical protein HMPREF1317_0300 [Schaalia georgiae F0490]
MPSDAMLAAVSVPTGGREFYTPAALAAELDMSVDALKVLRSRGGGPPFVRVGRRVVYPVVGVRIWALQHMIRGGASVGA